jgi:hypothetical protein
MSPLRDEVGPRGRNHFSPHSKEDQAVAKLSTGRVLREVVFYAYPRLIFAWPIILLGFLLYPLDAWGWSVPTSWPGSGTARSSL